MKTVMGIDPIDDCSEGCGFSGTARSTDDDQTAFGFAYVLDYGREGEIVEAAELVRDQAKDPSQCLLLKK
jgi:hypothetical protein